MNKLKLKNKIKKILGPRMMKFLKYNIPALSAKESYSQAGEDLLLDLFLRHKHSGFYVDIGAHDHIDLSNTYKFYKRGWKGIHIEPNHERLNNFKKYRPDTINLNIGIGNNENTKFFIFDSEALSTFSEEEVRRHEALGHKIIKTVDVEIARLEDVFKIHLKDTKIDFMSVDTEGYDLEVLKTNNWDNYRPSFIVVETAEYEGIKFGKKLNHIYDPFMLEIGYEKVADTYINTIYHDQKNKII